MRYYHLISRKTADTALTITVQRVKDRTKEGRAKKATEQGKVVNLIELTIE